MNYYITGMLSPQSYTKYIHSSFLPENTWQKSKVYVLCANQLSFDTFMYSERKLDNVDYIFVECVEDLPINECINLLILNDFHDNKNPKSILEKLGLTV